MGWYSREQVSKFKNDLEFLRNRIYDLGVPLPSRSRDELASYERELSSVTIDDLDEEGFELPYVGTVLKNLLGQLEYYYRIFDTQAKILELRACIREDVTDKEIWHRISILVWDLNKLTEFYLGRDIHWRNKNGMDFWVVLTQNNRRIIQYDDEIQDCLKQIEESDVCLEAQCSSLLQEFFRNVLEEIEQSTWIDSVFTKRRRQLRLVLWKLLESWEKGIEDDGGQFFITTFIQYARPVMQNKNISASTKVKDGSQKDRYL